MAQQPAKLLIIDDEERIRHLFLAFLEDYDEFESKAVSSAEDALSELAKEQYDLCIVDIRLPGMDGQDFILHAQARGLCPHFVLHTGSIDYGLPEELAQLGMTEEDILHKPCDMQLMLDRIRHKLQATGA